MEKVGFQGNFYSVPSKPPEEKKSSKKSGTPRLFGELLEAREEEEQQQAQRAEPMRQGRDLDTEIGKALDAVHSTGDKLKKNTTLDTIAEYKEAVRKFLRIVVDSGFEAHEDTPLQRRNKEEQRHIQIRVVNEKLERLAAQVMHSQKNELEILRRVDEIYGLLIDLRH